MVWFELSYIVSRDEEVPCSDLILPSGGVPWRVTGWLSLTSSLLCELTEEPIEDIPEGRVMLDRATNEGKDGRTEAEPFHLLVSYHSR